MVMSSFSGNILLSPVDLLETIFIANNSAFSRIDKNEITNDVFGEYCEYSLGAYWQEESSLLHFSVSLDLSLDDCDMGQVWQLLGLINQRLSLGHFEITQDKGVLQYRYSLPLVALDNLDPILLEDISNIAINEAKRFTESFLLLINGYDSETALDSSLLVCEGNS